MSKRKLTRDELVEHIRQTMPKDYNEIEQIAFIEREVALQMCFDETYLWGDRQTKQKIYKLARDEAYKLASKQEEKFNIYQKRKLICVTMAEKFVYVAKKLGLNAKLQRHMVGMGIETGEGEIFKRLSLEYQDHVCTIVELSNGNGIEIDIQNDLFALQTRSMPKDFGCHRHGNRYQNGVKIQILDPDLVKETFRKVYQLGENERFTDEYIMGFAASKGGKTPIEMLEAFMSDERIQKELQNAGCVEASKLYKRILKICYGGSSEQREFYSIFERDKAIIDECVLVGKENTKRYSFCIYAEDDEQKGFYVYSKKTRKMVKLSPEEVKSLLNGSVEIMLRPRGTRLQPELRQNLTSYINSANETLSEMSNPEVSVEDIFLDDDELE